jgi:excisionase family DNA binding protein
MEATTAESPYLTYIEAARYCRCERTTIYRAVKSGRLRASGPGMVIRFHRDDLDSWMRSRARN